MLIVYRAIFGTERSFPLGNAPREKAAHTGKRIKAWYYIMLVRVLGSVGTLSRGGGWGSLMHHPLSLLYSHGGGISSGCCKTCFSHKSCSSLPCPPHPLLPSGAPLAPLPCISISGYGPLSLCKYRVQGGCASAEIRRAPVRVSQRGLVVENFGNVNDLCL